MNAEWKINLSGQGEYKQFLLPPGRYSCYFSDVAVIQIRRGEKFCDPAKGQSPDDMLDKIRFSFMPANEKVLASCPPDQVAEITALFTPSFGTRAKLPGFLSQMSEDGVVPAFSEGEDLHKWLKNLLGCVYQVTVRPNEAKTRNQLVSVAFHSRPKVEDTPKQAPKTPRKAQEAPKQEALDVPFAEDDLSSDIPF